MKPFIIYLRIRLLTTICVYSLKFFQLLQSGAIMCLVAYACAQSPESKLQLIFLPGVQIPAGYGLAALMSVDTLGVIRGWKVFDHGGHLGGAIFAL